LPVFGLEYLGALAYPVQLQGFVNLDVPQSLAVLCVFPDRAWSLIELEETDFVSVRPQHWTFAKRASFRLRQTAWTEACVVTCMLVRRFFGADVAVDVEPEPLPVLESGERLGGLVAIAESCKLVVRPRK
jgi:hypothetical protein